MATSLLSDSDAREPTEAGAKGSGYEIASVHHSKLPHPRRPRKDIFESPYVQLERHQLRAYRALDNQPPRGSIAARSAEFARELTVLNLQALQRIPTPIAVPQSRRERIRALQKSL